MRTERDRSRRIPIGKYSRPIEAVFEKFRQLGSARQTMIWFREERIYLPQAKPGSEGREVVWQLATLTECARFSRIPATVEPSPLVDGHQDACGGGP